jgi:hypothetical protein
MGIALNDHDRTWLKVLLDNAVPREPGGTMDWEGAGRRAAESLLGFREKCRCTGGQLLAGTSPAPGCAVHDPVRDTAPTGEPRPARQVDA